MAAAEASLISSFTRRLEGKVALITGGASGIGDCTAKLFSKHGAKVVIADIQDERGQSVVESIGPPNSTYIHCDVTNEDHIKNAVDQTVSTYGKLDIMYNNAGITDPLKPRIVDNEKDFLQRVLDVNVIGVFLGMKHAARVMIPNRSGSIISTSSVGSVIAGGTPHAYTCSKHAVVGLTKSTAVELGQFGIRINSVAPFAVPTPLVKQFLTTTDEEIVNMANSASNLKGISLKADDIADAVLFLASDEASFISGHNLIVDGGYTITNAAINLFKYPEYT